MRSVRRRLEKEGRGRKIKRSREACVYDMIGKANDMYIW